MAEFVLKGANRLAYVGGGNFFAEFTALSVKHGAIFHAHSSFVLNVFNIHYMHGTMAHAH